MWSGPGRGLLAAVGAVLVGPPCHAATSDRATQTDAACPPGSSSADDSEWEKVLADAADDGLSGADAATPHPMGRVLLGGMGVTCCAVVLGVAPFLTIALRRHPLPYVYLHACGPRAVGAARMGRW